MKETDNAEKREGNYRGKWKEINQDTEFFFVQKEKFSMWVKDR